MGKTRGLDSYDLGGAFNCPDGYTPIDLVDNPGIVGDALEVLGNLPESGCRVIRASDFLEHVPDKIKVMNIVYRALAHGGVFLTTTPSTDGRGAFQDPTHVSYWNENSFWYYTNRDFAQYVPEIQCRFQASRLVSYFPGDWHRQYNIPYVRADLIAIKDGPRQGGELLI